MSRSAKDKASRDFFKVRFTRQFQKGKVEGLWKSETEFGKKLKPPVSRGTVAKWKDGKIPTPNNLRQICKIFEVSEDYFDIKNATREELYQYTSDYMTKLVDDNAVPYCEEIGLSVDFLYSVRSIMGDTFDKTFPIWSPIVKNPNLLSTEEYIRSTKRLLTSAKTDERQSIFQCTVHDRDRYEPDGRLVTMCRADLDFLRDIQEEVCDYIEFLFMKRRKGQIEEAKEATRLSLEPLSNGQSTVKRLKSDDLKRIDKYGRYTDEEPETSEVREATQDDFDDFSGIGKNITDANGMTVQVKEGD